MKNLFSPALPEQDNKTILEGQPEGFNFAERVYNISRGKEPDADVEYRGPDLAKDIYEEVGGSQSPSVTNNGPVDEVKDRLPDLNVGDVFQQMPDEQNLSDAVIDRHPYFSKDESGDIGLNTPGLDIPGLPGLGDVNAVNPFKSIEETISGFTEFGSDIMNIVKLSVIGVLLIALVKGVLNSEYLN